MPTFSERLNEALEYRNMTAAELARALNVADAIMQLKSLRLYILFLVALGQTEGCFYTIFPVSANCCFTVRFIVLTMWICLLQSN